MDKKGSVLIYGIMLALVIIILALAIAPKVNEFTNTARNQTNGDTIGLDCSNSSISKFDKATCVIVDLNPFYFIIGLVCIGGAIATAKIIFA